MVLGLLAALVIALTIVNVVRVVELSRHNTELSSRIGRDRSEAARLAREATRIRRGIDQKELTSVIAAAREANTLIDQRTFSWTAFFNQIEATLPADVMLTSVRPTVDRNGTTVSLLVIGRSPEDIFEFTEKLKQTGAFENPRMRQDEPTEDGLHRAVVDARYVQGAEPERVVGEAR
jgi:Tfp pilus assembly protein PilN